MSPAKAAHVFSDILLYVASFLIGVAALLFPFFPFRPGYTIFLFVGIVLLMQWGMLSSRRNWLRIRVQSSGRPMKRAVIGAAFFAMLLSVGFLATLLEVVSSLKLMELKIGWLAIGGYLFLWAFWACLFFVFWRGSDHPTPVSRMVGRLIAGTAVQTFVATVVFAWNPQNESCECARGSFTGLSIGGTLLVWLFGPGLLILGWREHERQQRMKDQDLPATPPQNLCAANPHCDSPLSAMGVGIIALLLILIVILEINTPFYTTIGSKPVHGIPVVPPPPTPPVSTPPASTPPVTTPAGKPAQKNAEIREDPAVFEFKRGVSYSERKNWEVAIVYYTEAIRLNPRYAAAWLNRGIAHREKGEIDKAIRDFTGAIRWRPGFADAFYNRGVAHQEQGDPAKADADFAKAHKFKGLPAGGFVVSPAKSDSTGSLPIRAIRVLDKDTVLVVTSFFGGIDAARDEKVPDEAKPSSAQLRIEWSKRDLSTLRNSHRITKDLSFLAHAHRAMVSRGSKFPLHGVMISPDGSWLGVYGTSFDEKTNAVDFGSVIVWDTNSGQQIATWKIEGGSPYEVAISPSGKRVAVATAKGRPWPVGGVLDDVFELDEFGYPESSIQIFNVREGRREETLLTQPLVVSSLEFDHAGMHLCASIAEFDESDEGIALAGVVWRTRDWTRTVRIGFSARRTLLTAHPYESEVVLIGRHLFGPGRMELWDLRSGKKTGTVSSTINPRRPAGFSPDGKRFAFMNSTGGGFFATKKRTEEIAVLDMESGLIFARLREPKSVATAFSFTKDGRQIISGSSDGGIRIWKLPPSR